MKKTLLLITAVLFTLTLGVAYADSMGSGYDEMSNAAINNNGVTHFDSLRECTEAGGAGAGGPSGIEAGKDVFTDISLAVGPKTTIGSDMSGAKCLWGKEPTEEKPLYNGVTNFDSGAVAR